jgi:succinate-semialdehyde dehydrogenase/glutarate-semialdehyde dehydrogenase
MGIIPGLSIAGVRSHVGRGRLDAGTMTSSVFVNHPTAVKADIPFGGVKVSGYGNEPTESGIREFVTNKVIDVVDIDAPF